LRLSIPLFRLVTDPTEPGLCCRADGLTLGGQPLLRSGNFGLEPQPPDYLRQLLAAAYGPENALNAEALSSSLASIAGALNNGDLSRAMIASLMLRLPDIDDAGAVRPKAIAKANYQEDQARDENGRWTTDGADSGTVVAQAFPIPGTLFPPILPGSGVSTRPKKDDDWFPPPAIPQNDPGQIANENAQANVRAANSNEPQACPDSSYEPGSEKRTREQLLYQAQINGLPLGYHVLLNGIGYDGCRESDQTMLEAKLSKNPVFLIHKPLWLFIPGHDGSGR
jgi:hypothetical protein